MSLNKEQRETKKDLLKRIKAAQADLEHEVTMYNTVLSEAHQSLEASIELYNALCLEVEEFIADAAESASDKLSSTSGDEADQLSAWIECWTGVECMRQSPIDSPEEVESDCDGFSILDQLPDSVGDM